MIIMSIIEENLPFIVIGLMIIVIVVLAYYTFIKPKPKNKKSIDDQKETKIDQTSKATSMDESSIEETELETPKPIIVGESSKKKELNKDKDTSEEETDTIEFGKYHIVYRGKDNKWIVTREGSDKTIRVLHTKKEAIAYATIKAINQDTNIVIHGRDGKIEKQGY
ncbi:MAG: DUF2188 domain-containing protein [Tenericutes bacterium]|jgi:hypothetical protein|nr:DUF2188 domain-containing protein [Mycoplasmatota bacterium]